MLSYAKFHAHLATLTSDAEVSRHLKEFFSGIAPVISASRFVAIGWLHKRYFLVQFKHSADAVKVTNRYKLRSFAFDGVLIEVAQPSKNQDFATEQKKH